MKIWKVLRNIILLLLLWFTIHTILIIIDGVTDDDMPTDVAVVLGNKVELDGRPSQRSKMPS